MILLDASYLIRSSRAGSSEAFQLRKWIIDGQMLATSAVAWMEFLNGPLAPEQTSEMLLALGGQILPFAFRESALASFLFHQTGGRRGSKIDCMIAATAIHANASLATSDVEDFKAFEFAGLTLI